LFSARQSICAPKFALSARFSISLHFTSKHFTPAFARLLYLAGMSFRGTPPILIAPIPPPAPQGRVRYNPRRDMTDEALAGLLWMSLDVPEDTTLDEMKSVAQQLGQLIRCGAGAALVESQLDYWQRLHFCRFVKADQLRALARRAIKLAAPH